MIPIDSKLPGSSDSIFSVVSKLVKEHDAINLGQGFPNFDCPDDLKDLITHYLKAGKNQYAPMAGTMELREALAKKMNTAYSSNINPITDITITAGATQAIFTTIQAFITQGDEVILIEPAYDSYAPSVHLAGGNIKSVQLKAPTYKIDWDSVADKITDATKMIILNSPHNPTGQILDNEDHQQLEKLLEGSNILILSDEVYEHLVYDDSKHISLAAHPRLAQRTIATFSFGKTFHATGWKMGYCVAPENLMKEIRNIHQWNVFSVNSFLQYALAEYLGDPSSYNTLSSFYQAKRDLFQEGMSKTPFKALPCHGTYFQLYDYSDISSLDDMAFTEYLVKEIGVGTIPLSPFYSANYSDKVLRFCFAKTDDILLQAIDRLAAL